MKIITHCASPFEAELIKGKLENEGLHPVVFNNAMNSIYPPVILIDTFTIDVRVPDEEEEAARKWVAKDLHKDAEQAESEDEQAR